MTWRDPYCFFFFMLIGLKRIETNEWYFLFSSDFLFTSVETNLSNNS